MKRLGALLERLLGGQLPGLHRLPALVVHVGDHRLHDQHRQKQRQPEQHLIGRRGLRSQRLPQKVQHDGDAQKRRDRHDDRRQQRQQRQQNDDLHRHAQRRAVAFPADMPNREKVRLAAAARGAAGDAAVCRTSQCLTGLPPLSRHAKLSSSVHPEGEQPPARPISQVHQVQRLLRSERQSLDALQTAGVWLPRAPRRQTRAAAAPIRSRRAAPEPAPPPQLVRITSITAAPQYRPGSR